MQSRGCPLVVRSLRRVAVAVGIAATIAISASGCSGDTAEIDAMATIAVTTPEPDLGPQRDKDVAWIYHLSKTHATDDLVTRLDHERERLAAEAASDDSTQSNAAFTWFPGPLHPSPTASPLAPTPGPSATATATPKPADPLATLPEKQLDPAIVLALYHIDPDTYKKLFVDNYPTTADGVQHDFGDRLVSARLTKDGENYPIVALARIAATNDVALAKLYTAASVANGEVADRYAAVIAAFTKGHPDDLFPMLVRLEMPTRLAIISQHAGWCRVRPGAVLDEVPEDLDQLALQRDLRTTMSGCTDYLKKPDVRHLADRRTNRHAAPGRTGSPKSGSPKPPAASQTPGSG